MNKVSVIRSVQYTVSDRHLDTVQYTVSNQDIVESKGEVFYDYENQAWVVNGRYEGCGHLMACSCYGRIHAGEWYTIPKEG